MEVKVTVTGCCTELMVTEMSSEPDRPPESVTEAVMV